MKYLKNFRNDEVIKFINSSDLDFIQDCINRGIDINIHGRNGWNILLYSCRFKNIDVIKLLIIS